MFKLHSEYLVLPLALLVIMGSYWLDASHRNLAREVFAQEESRLLELRSQTFATRIYTSLQHLEGIGSLVEELSAARRWDEVENTLALLMLTNPDYVQARFINMQGRELVRVNRNADGSLYRVVKQELQDKSSRDYTRRLQALPDGHFHVSRFDLNQENGVVERPFWSTYRVGLRLGAAENESAGFLILNIAGEPVLGTLKQDISHDLFGTYLVNAEGLRPDRGYVWSEERKRAVRTREELDNALRVIPALATRQAVQDDTDGSLWLTWPIVLDTGRERSVDMEEPWYLVRQMPAAMLTSSLPGLASFHAVLLVVPVAALMLFLALRSGRLSRTAEVQSRIEADMQVQLAERLEQDVSLRTRQLQDARNFIETLTDHLPILIAYWNPELRCEFMNRSFADWYGTDKQKGLNKHLREFVGEEQFELRQIPLQQVLQGKAAAIEVMYPRASDGVDRLLSMDYLPLGADNPGFISVARDITDQRNAERILQQRTREAEQAAIAKDTFLSHMSHEIRTPMSAILGMLVLLRDTELDSLQRSYVDRSYHASESLLNILNDILDLARLEADQMPLENVDFELEELLQRSVDLFALSAANKGLRLSVDVDMRLPDRLHGDPLRLGQILSNLVGNAVKFTAQGDICLSICLGEWQGDNPQIVFEVRDTGIGMTAEQQSRIFDAFGQADAGTARQFGGSGLGLSICRGLAERLGGTLTVASRYGEGSTFTLVLEMKPGCGARRYQDRELHPLRLYLFEPSDLLSINLTALIEVWGGEVRSLTPEVLQQANDDPHSVILLNIEQLQRLPSHWLADVDVVVNGERRLPNILVVVTLGRMARDSQALMASNVMIMSEPLTPARLYMALHDCRQGIDSRGGADRVQALESLPPLHLLVVDDLEVNREIACRLLAKLGASAVAVESGEAALEAVASQVFDAVLMDIHMNGMNGCETTRALPADRALPVIALSASVQEQDRMAAMNAGMVGYLTKPLLIEALQAQLYDLFGAKSADSEAVEVEAAVAASTASDKNTWLAELPASIDPDRVLHQFMDDEELYLDCLQAFAESLPEMLAGLERAWKADNQMEGQRLAHRLKGGAGTVANVVLETAALTLEQSLKQSGDWYGLEALLEAMAQVKSECAELEAGATEVRT